MSLNSLAAKAAHQNLLDDELEFREDWFSGSKPVNPFTKLRQSCGLSSRDLAALTGIDRKAITRCEAGMYAFPLPSLMKYWTVTHSTPQSYPELTQAYEDYQINTRKFYYQFFGPDLTSPDPFTERHPLKQLREHRPSPVAPYPEIYTTLMDCCRALCVPMDSIQMFEDRPHRVQTLPKILKLALEHAGYPTVDVLEFQNLYQIWRGQFAVTKAKF